MFWTNRLVCAFGGYTVSSSNGKDPAKRDLAKRDGHGTPRPGPQLVERLSHVHLTASWGRFQNRALCCRLVPALPLTNFPAVHPKQATMQMKEKIKRGGCVWAEMNTSDVKY